MAKEYWSIHEVVEIFEVDEGFLDELEREEIVCPTCRDDPSKKLFTASELEKLRLVKILSEDMGVNRPGIEVILQMRRTMFNMRQQFDDILEDVSRTLRENLERSREARKDL